MEDNFFNNYLSDLMSQNNTVEPDVEDEENQSAPEESDFIKGLRDYDDDQKSSLNEEAIISRLDSLINEKLESLNTTIAQNDWFASEDGQDYMSLVFDTKEPDDAPGAIPYTPSATSNGFYSAISPTSSGGGRSRNNYGNIRDPRTGQFRNFATPEQGRQALVDQLNIYQTDKSRTGVKSSSTLAQAMAIYAPKGDGANNPQVYANFIAKKLGISTNTPINQIDANQWADAISIMEGNKNVGK